MTQFNNSKLTSKTYLRLLITSLICIMLCLTCFIGTTYAYYTDSVVSIDNFAMSATYSVRVTDIDDNEYLAGSDGTYTLARGREFKLKAQGTATTGYVVVTVGEAKYYKSLAPGQEITIMVDSADMVDFNVEFTWGSYDSTGKTALGDTI